MKIVVLVKHVPDAAGSRTFSSDGTVDRKKADCRLSELDEYAIEQALRIVESGVVAEIVYLTMGPSSAADTLRKALSMGGDRAVHISDEALHGSDALTTSRVLAAGLAKLGFDLVICGMASTDGAMSVIPAMLAERLGVAQATFASELAVDEAAKSVRVRRDGDESSREIEARLPAIVSVTDHSGQPRYPSFKGIMSSKSKPLEPLTLADLGLSVEQVGGGAAAAVVRDVAPRPPREVGRMLLNEEGAVVELVDFLVHHQIV